MSFLLIKNIDALVSCDDRDTVYRNTDLLIKDNLIYAIGPELGEDFRKVQGADDSCRRSGWPLS